VIRRDGDSLILEGAVNLDSVPALVGAVEEHLRQGARVVDFRNVTEVDSAAVALALEWLRQAAETGIGSLYLTVNPPKTPWTITRTKARVPAQASHFRFCRNQRAIQFPIVRKPTKEAKRRWPCS